MKTKLYKAFSVMAVALSPLFMAAQNITEPTEYYLIHSSGNHVAKNADGRAVLEDAEATGAKMLTFTPVGDGYYTISHPDGGYLGLQGSYTVYFINDSEANQAKYKIEETDGFFVKLRCKSNGKYLGTDDSKNGAYVYSDKDGSDTRHLWYLATDPTMTPPDLVSNYVINPAAERQTIEGWGVSLCWWANMCGKWSDEKIDQIVDWLVSPEGLNFSIFRYNIGGGDDPDHQNCNEHHMAGGKGLRAEMEGFKDSSDGPYIWTRDEAQRKIMLKIREKRPDAIFEAFSNSAPWYMTYSGCCSGNDNSSKDNLKPEYYEEFAHYLVDVCKHYKDEYGIEFKTLDPFNEPMTSYWGRNGGQEGCHFDVNSQIAFLKVLAPVLEASGLSTVISASDETSVEQSVKDFLAYRDAGILDLVGQWNTHTYTVTNKQRTKISSLCKEENKHLWMSEVGAGGSGFVGNLNMAQKVMNDMRYIEPAAWIDWQYIEENNDQWCLVRANFNAQSYQRVKNYYVRSHFSRFMKEGYTVLTTTDTKVTAARSADGSELVLVALNTGGSPIAHSVDLSMFDSVDSNPTAVYTDELHSIADYTAEVNDKVLSFSVPAMSIVTVVVGVQTPTGLSMAPAEGKDYLVIPRLAPDKALDVVGSAVQITDMTLAPTQVWNLTADGPGFILKNKNGDIITHDGTNYALTATQAAADGQTFLLDMIDNLYHKVGNAEGKVFDLEGENATAGTGIGMWTYSDNSSPTHRHWLFLQLPDGYDPAAIDSPVAPEQAQPIAFHSQDGVLSVCKLVDGPGTLSVYNAAGMCLYNASMNGATVDIPLAAGYYIVCFRGAQKYARPVFVK